MGTGWTIKPFTPPPRFWQNTSRWKNKNKVSKLNRVLHLRDTYICISDISRECLVARAESLVYIEGGPGIKPLPDLLHRTLNPNDLVPKFAVVLKCLVAERRATRRCINLTKAFVTELASEVLIDWHERICELVVLK